MFSATLGSVVNSNYLAELLGVLPTLTLLVNYLLFLSNLYHFYFFLWFLVLDKMMVYSPVDNLVLFLIFEVLLLTFYH